MALALDIWASLILGILYLTFNAFPTRVFGKDRGFNMQMSGLSFLGIGIGMLIALISQPYWIKVYKEQRIPFWERAMRREQAAELEAAEKAGTQLRKAPEPESRLLIGMAGAVLVPIGKSPRRYPLRFVTLAHESI